MPINCQRNCSYEDKVFTIFCTLDNLRMLDTDLFDKYMYMNSLIFPDLVIAVNFAWILEETISLSRK